MYITCLKMLQTRKNDFEALMALHPQDLISQWEEMDTKPKIVNKEVISAYEPQFGKNGILLLLYLSKLAEFFKGPPTAAKRLKELVQAEKVVELSGGGEEGDAQLINTGIFLQEQQCVL